MGAKEAVGVRLDKEQAAYLRSLGFASTTEALRALIDEARAGASLEAEFEMALQPLRDQIEELHQEVEAYHSAMREVLGEVVEQATQKAVARVSQALMSKLGGNK